MRKKSGIGGLAAIVLIAGAIFLFKDKLKALPGLGGAGSSSGPTGGYSSSLPPVFGGVNKESLYSPLITGAVPYWGESVKAADINKVYQLSVEKTGFAGFIGYLPGSLITTLAGATNGGLTTAQKDAAYAATVKAQSTEAYMNNYLSLLGMRAR